MGTPRLYSARLAEKSTAYLEKGIADLETRVRRLGKEMQRNGGHMVATNYANTMSTLTAYRQCLADKTT